MKKNVIYLGAVATVLLLLFSSIGISAGEIRPDDVEYNLDIDAINAKLSNLGLSLDSTFSEYKKAVYDSISDKSTDSSLILAAQLNDLDEIFIEIEGMGVNPDMTMKETIGITGFFFGTIYLRAVTWVQAKGWILPAYAEIAICENINTGIPRIKITNLFGRCVFRFLPKNNDYKVYLQDVPSIYKIVNNLVLFDFVLLVYAQ